MLAVAGGIAIAILVIGLGAWLVSRWLKQRDSPQRALNKNWRLRADRWKADKTRAAKAKKGMKIV
ncbi:hypothetical protein N7466_006352 [Penicillium verhagenii]|uniref:uncharacterized protein n=1 Tax=Penicillium verhagenii TaxID=1562060 RepID=UPI0025451F65|nr:uncharacterized protein N7466_006352 [Penicillium verhagenii]KAJ5930859.1 hypothetical protein N7466_006352 [Penicillium verhagenii]